MVTCPVCGKYEFADEDDFDVCSVCGWENDGLQYKDIHFSGGANFVSVVYARYNYAKTGQCMTEEDAIRCRQTHLLLAKERTVQAGISLQKALGLPENRDISQFLAEIEKLEAAGGLDALKEPEVENG